MGRFKKCYFCAANQHKSDMIKRHVPNAITCCNLLSGCFSILFLLSGMPVKAALMIFVAAIFDFFDGFAARLLNAHSPIGADLDSLCDVVSFGVAPGFIMYFLIGLPLEKLVLPLLGVDLLPCVAFLLPVFSALRLARFNVDASQTTSFLGLPAPAMAVFMASLPLAFLQLGLLWEGVLNPYAGIAIVLIFSIMMVCRRRFISFKMKSVRWKGNETRWIILGVGVAGFAVFQFVALPFILMFYVLMSLFFPPQVEQTGH